MADFRLKGGPISGTIRIKGLVEDVDRHGNVRVYLRRQGMPKVRILASPGSPEFLAEVEAALKAPPSPPARRATAAADEASLQRLITAYYASAEFRRLAGSTQTVRRRILDALCARTDKLGGSWGAKPYRALELRHIRALRDEKADTPDAANNLVKVLRSLYSWAVNARLADHNPATGIRSLTPRNPAGHHSWSMQEIAQYQAHHALGTKARLAFDLLLFTGQRRSDIVRLGRQHLSRDADGEWITLTQTKNAGRRPVTLAIPVLPPLRASLDAMAPTGHLTFLVTEYGRPYTAAGFGGAMREWCDAAGLPGCSAHGLRKAFGAIFTELGATTKELQALLGHSTLQQTETYTRSAQQRLLAKAAADRFVNRFVPPKPALASGGTKTTQKASKNND